MDFPTKPPNYPASQRNMSSSSSSSSGPKKIITLTSFDGQSFEMEESAALQSRILGFMIDENCADDPIQIPLPRVTGDVLSKVVEYCTKHAQSGIDNDTLKAWDRDLVRLDASTLRDLVLVIIPYYFSLFPSIFSIHLLHTYKIYISFYFHSFIVFVHFSSIKVYRTFYTGCLWFKKKRKKGKFTILKLDYAPRGGKKEKKKIIL